MAPRRHPWREISQGYAIQTSLQRTRVPHKVPREVIPPSSLTTRPVSADDNIVKTRISRLSSLRNETDNYRVCFVHRVGTQGGMTRVHFHRRLILSRQRRPEGELCFRELEKWPPLENTFDSILTHAHIFVSFLSISRRLLFYNYYRLSYSTIVSWFHFLCMDRFFQQIMIFINVVYS